MTTTHAHEHPGLIKHLLSLVERDDRAALARLRRGLGKPPGSDITSFPDIVPFIPPAEDRAYSAWPYFVVAALFASHPVQGRDRFSIGAAMRRLPDSPSRDGRFRALLNAHRDDLPTHLRQVVNQLKAKGIHIDWSQLLRDLKSWNHEDQYVQRRWARDFYSESNPDTTP